MYKRILYLLFIVTCWSCSNNSGTEKYQSKRNNIIDAHEKVKEIVMNEDVVMIGSMPRLYLCDDYLLIRDSRSSDKLIYLFNKHTFTFVTSIAKRGQGPGEITQIGHIGYDQTRRKIYVSDHGKQTIFSYDLDSILVDSLYIPKIKMKMDKGFFPDKYQYINDTLSYCRVIEPIGVSDFKDGAGILNMKTGVIKQLGNNHSDLDRNEMNIAASMENNIYVESYFNYDLLTICDLNGNLKYNIYGPDWSKQRDRKNHFGKVEFIKDKIVASYGRGDFQTNRFIPTDFLVFDINGNYLQTISTGYWITDYCYDQEDNRIIMSLNDADMQFAYLDLKGLID